MKKTTTLYSLHVLDKRHEIKYRNKTFYKSRVDVFSFINMLSVTVIMIFVLKYKNENVCTRCFSSSGQKGRGGGGLVIYTSIVSKVSLQPVGDGHPPSKCCHLIPLATPTDVTA